jgi:hypothetical protein
MKRKRSQRRKPPDATPRAALDKQRPSRPLRGVPSLGMPGRWSDWKAIGSYGTVGLEVVLSVLFGLFVGRWADGKLGTSPYLALAGFALGVAAAGRAVFRVAGQMKRETAHDEWSDAEIDRPARFEHDEPAKGRKKQDERPDEPDDPAPPS